MRNATIRCAIVVGCIATFLIGVARQPVEPIGSTRNSRVAYPIPAEVQASARPKLTLLTGTLPATTLEEMRFAAPNVTIVDGLNRQTALAHAATAHAADARLLTPEFLAAAPNLVWVVSPSAGVDRLMGIKSLADRDTIVVTNSRAVHGPAIADHAFAMLLTLTRNLREYNALQQKQRWEDAEGDIRPSALQGKTMLVVGLGGIGSEVAKRANGFDMRVIATRRSDASSPEFVKKVGKPEDLLGLLPEADVVAICVPLTAETEKMFDARAFGVMKPGAILINVARGRVVETTALLEALRGGRLAGACLDVTDPEPLPAGHPLWKEPHVIITPHVSADADLTQDRFRLLIIENVRRFGAGEPLLNVVDMQTGY
ncbi:MAG: D-2-hydroxyacid dehydrogenase [Phycisphaeraceae bacterium]|nr:D-2-hydroxyacid dehydrogenase [Phycisphaeraceae bacterium]